MARLFLFLLLSLLFLISFWGYLLAFRRLQTPPPPQTLLLQREEGDWRLRGRVVRLSHPDPARQVVWVRRGPREGLEAVLYLYLEATDAPYSTEGYPGPVMVALLDAQGQVLKVESLEPGQRLDPGLAYRGALEVWRVGIRLGPGDRVVPLP